MSLVLHSLHLCPSPDYNAGQVAEQLNFST